MIATAQPRYYPEDTVSTYTSDCVITVVSGIDYYDPFPDPVETFKRGVREAKAWQRFLASLSDRAVRDCAIQPQPARPHPDLSRHTPIRGPP